MATLPLNISSYGIGSDKLGDMFHIFFMSCYNNKKLYLGEDCLTEDISSALKTDDMSFITEELMNLLKDGDFMNYLESEMVF